MEHRAHIFKELEHEVLQRLRDDNVLDSDIVVNRSIDMRYRSQTHELIIPVVRNLGDPDSMRELVLLFEKTYEETYDKGSGFREAGIELTTFRVAGIGRTVKPAFSKFSPTPRTARANRRIFDVRAGDWMDAMVVDWMEMVPDEEHDGPVVIEPRPRRSTTPVNDVSISTK